MWGVLDVTFLGCGVQQAVCCQLENVDVHFQHQRRNLQLHQAMGEPIRSLCAGRAGGPILLSMLRQYGHCGGRLQLRQCLTSRKSNGVPGTAIAMASLGSTRRIAARSQAPEHM